MIIYYGKVYNYCAVKRIGLSLYLVIWMGEEKVDGNGRQVWKHGQLANCLYFFGKIAAI